MTLRMAVRLEGRQGRAPKSRTSSRLRSAGWGILTFLAIGTGLGALRYGLPNVPFPANLDNSVTRRPWLVTHATFSAIALLSGPWQFLAVVRRRSLQAHRSLGRVYCGAVSAGWLSSLPIAAHAQTGAAACAGFLALGAVWICATAAGYFAIRGGRMEAHRAWMTRSYALTAAAITLRLYLPLVFVMHAPFNVGYPMVAWACWIPNLLFAEWLVRRRGRLA